MSSGLSFTGRRWTQRHGAAPLRLTGRPLVSALHLARGIDPVAPGARLTLSPHLIPETTAAAKRIIAAADAREAVGIFGDYDCDGITATAQLLRYFRRNGVEPFWRLPHRVHDGYGLSEGIVRECIAAGLTLLVTVDTGASSAREIALAADAGIDVIVVDHHRMPQRPERAFAVVHPALGESFPLPHPSAAGLAYLLLTALEGEEWEWQEIDLALATLGTVADLVELTGHNRTLVSLGLDALGRLPASPLSRFVRGVCPQGPVSAVDVAFRLAPRINAAGRMGSADVALKALLEDGPHGSALETLNAERQRLTAAFLEEAGAQIVTGDVPPLIAAASERYPHGIIGLLAGKFTETYGRPSMVAAIRDGRGSASLRSTGAYNIVDGLTHCSDLLLSYGGHAQAGGATFDAAHWDAFRDRLREHVSRTVDPQSLIPSLPVDAEMPVSDVTLELCESLASLSPFGQGNPEPQFLLRGVRLENARRVGADGKHLQATVAGRKLIGFGLGQLLPSCAVPVDAVCRIGIDTWNGRRSPQLFLQDLRAQVEEPADALLRGAVRAA